MKKLVAAASLAGVLLMAALVLSVFALLRAGPEQKVVKAERFEVVDSQGNGRVIMSILGGDRPSVSLIDAKGEARAWLFLARDGSPNLVLQEGPRLMFTDKDTTIRALIRLDPDGAPVTSYADGSGKVRAIQSLDASGAPHFDFYDADGKVVWTAR